MRVSSPQVKQEITHDGGSPLVVDSYHTMSEALQTVSKIINEIFSFFKFWFKEK